MASRGGGGRDRFRRDCPPRLEDKSHQGRPPSRHLWVGNLSHCIDENVLSQHFLRFGELDSIACQPGRSYAFINFKREEDAVSAMRELHGFPVAGMPFKIEFAKAEKSTPPCDDFLHRRDEQRPQMDSRTRHASPDPYCYDKSRMSEKNAEPSEVLWIGFPASLKVDEMILRKAFSPFGEIEKVTAFSGRSYAFVRFRSVMAACRAKETLQGKLFGNPRVHICFAKSESGSSNNGRSSMNAPPSPNFLLNGHPSFPGNIWPDRNTGSFMGETGIRSSHFVSNLESGDPNVYGFGRKGTLWADGNNTFEERRLPDLGSELGLPEDMNQFRSSPTRDGGAHFHDFSPQKFPTRSASYEDQWDLPEDISLFHGMKKLKTSSHRPEKELPEYPFSGSEQEKHDFSRIPSDFSQPVALEKTLESGTFGYKQISDRPMNLIQPHGERSDNGKAPYENFHVGSGILHSNPAEWKVFTPETRQPSLNEWKWEGTIAKGGTPVCRARCFPVGKVLDIMLPEFLDCTARTGLDMLAKHYYQAANAWVVFFVPETDGDIGFYNEFMHYLGEKQRAAVAKLDDKNTLFLVPPSDFSEKVLKVPGQLSISGVVLRLEHPGSNFGSLHHSQEKKVMPYQAGNTPSCPNPTPPPPPLPSGPCPVMTSLSNLGANDVSFSGDVSTSSAAPPLSFPGSGSSIPDLTINDKRQENVRNLTMGAPTWSPGYLQNSMISDTRNVGNNPVFVQEQHHSNDVQEASSSHHHYTSGNIPLSGSGSNIQEIKPMPIAGLQPEPFLGQQRQPLTVDFRQTNTNNSNDQPENPFGNTSRHRYAAAAAALQNNNNNNNNILVPSAELSAFQFGQVQHISSNELVENQQLQRTTQAEMDADPQKRLQATLQLAAALLQQIHQGKGN